MITLEKHFNFCRGIKFSPESKQSSCRCSFRGFSFFCWRPRVDFSDFYFAIIIDEHKSRWVFFCSLKVKPERGRRGEKISWRYDWVSKESVSIFVYAKPLRFISDNFLLFLCELNKGRQLSSDGLNEVCADLFLLWRKENIIKLYARSSRSWCSYLLMKFKFKFVASCAFKRVDRRSSRSIWHDFHPSMATMIQSHFHPSTDGWHLN